MCFGTILTWVIFAILSTTGFTAERFDPAARAKFIAPFIHEQTIGIVHVDLTRIEVDPILDQVFPLLGRFPTMMPPRREELAEARAEIRNLHGTLIRAGLKDLYYFVTFTHPGRTPPGEGPDVGDRAGRNLPPGLPYLVIPLAEGSREEVVREVLKRNFPVVERQGNVLVCSRSPLVLEQVKSITPDPRPELTAAFEAAGDRAVQVLLLPPKYFRRVIEETLPELPDVLGGGSSKVFTRGILWAAAGIDLPPRSAVRLVVQAEDAPAAEILQAKLKELMGQAEQLKEVQSFIQRPKETFALLTPRVEENRLVLALDDSNQAMTTLFSLILPPIEKARLAAMRASCLNNLKIVGIAMHNYYNAKKHFPLPASLGPDKRALLSWRVHLLPYLEGGGKLYKQFHLDEPWDSEHNRKLIDQMPPVFKHPLSKKAEGYTNYLLPVGNGAGFDPDTPTKFTDITDGSSYTIMIVEVDDEHAVIWTKPDDLPYDPQDPRKGLGGFFNGGFNTALFDGSVRTIKPDVSVKTLRAMFTRAGGEAVDW